MPFLYNAITNKLDLSTSGGVSAVSGSAPITASTVGGAVTVGMTAPLAGQYGGTGIANTGLTINLASGASSYLMTSDSSGNGTWQAPPGSSLVSYSPTIGDGTNNFTMTIQNGGYCVIGPHLVWVFAHIQWTDQGSAGAGNLIQVSLPFACGSDRATIAPGYMAGFPMAASQFVYLMQSGQAYLTVGGMSGGNTVQENCGPFGTSGELQLSGVYYTA